MTADREHDMTAAEILARYGLEADRDEWVLELIAELEAWRKGDDEKPTTIMFGTIGPSGFVPDSGWEQLTRNDPSETGMS